MDGSQQLLTNIQFNEAKKGGYERAQVDNFLHELSIKVGELQNMLRLATQRAEAAEVALAEAVKARDAARAEAAQAREAATSSATAAAATAASEVEAATGVLAMAQKTAESTIREAEGTAEQIVAEARDRAGAIVVEVEREAERRREEASAEAERLRTERVTVIEHDVERLGAQRDSLQLDVDLLRHYLDEHRAKIRTALDDINQLLDQPGALTPGPAPALGGTATDTHLDSLARPVADPAPAAPAAEPATTPAPTPAPEPAAATADPVAAPSEPVATPEAPTTAATTVVVGGEVPATAAPGAPEAGPTIVTVEDLGTAGSTDPAAEFPEVKAPAIFEQPAAEPAAPSPIDLTGGGAAPSLFSEGTDQPTQAYDVLAEGDAPDASTLGTVDDDADEAMRAFFEQDLDEESKESKKGFLRRR